MADRATWIKRVAEWRASGLSSPEFCKGRAFTPGGLRFWASQLKQQRTAPASTPAAPAATLPVPPPAARAPLPAASTPAAPSIRLRRVVRGPAPARAAREPAPREVAGSAALTLECGAVRVAVRPGFDRATLAAVLDVLAAREGRA